MHLNTTTYTALYQQSLNEPDTFWAEQAERFVSWYKPWQHVQTGNFTELNNQWFTGGKLNASYNCLDRHLAEHADKTAIIWEGDDASQQRRFSYAELHEAVCRCANALKVRGIGKGDRVGIYLPLIPEAVIAMLACCRIGAIHSVVFAGFSPQALKSRLLDADCCALITSDVSVRAGKTIVLKQQADQALQACPKVNSVFVVRQTQQEITWVPERDIDFAEACQAVTADCKPEIMDAEDPLFILYTSGSTGKPKGLLHTTGGYLVYSAMTFYYVFDYQPDDIYWCTADVGWITGHSYLVYGPLANAATIVMFGGVPNYPTPARCWEMIDRHQVTTFYTAPTAIRALMREGDEYVTQSKRDSLKLLGTVGEPINPDVWEWYHKVVGSGRCPIVDTWWQTETGGIALSPLPGATPLKPGSASWPLFGIEPEIIDGQLFIKQPWPGIARTIYGDPERYRKTYFGQVPGKFCSGDGAYQDDDHYYWITGRIDDVMNVSGHRLGSAELESALVEHPDVAESAVVGMPHPIKGEGLYAFVTLKAHAKPSDNLKANLIQHVREVIGPIATLDHIQWADELPKTRSGKIMRRILRKIITKDIETLGDTSTLANPAVIDDLIAGCPALEGK